MADPGADQTREAHADASAGQEAAFPEAALAEAIFTAEAQREDGVEVAAGDGREEERRPETGTNGAIHVGPAAREHAEETIAELHRQLAEASEQRDEHLNDLRRVQASFENYRKRVQSETEAVGLALTRATLSTILPILDEVDRLLGQEANLAASDGVARRQDGGLQAVGASLAGAAERLGLSRIDQTGVPFDHDLHEAVQVEHAAPGSDKESFPHKERAGGPTVAAVLRPGWAHQGHTLRPALVRVAIPARAEGAQAS